MTYDTQRVYLINRRELVVLRMAIFLRISKHLLNTASICLLLFFFARASESVRNPFNPELLSSKSYSEIYTLTTLYNDETFI